MLREERRKREKAMSVWSTVPLVPSAFSPAFSSCSLTTSFMCCHWGSPSLISWTLTSPLGLLPLLYLVILILTWSSAAWSELTRQKRDKHHSWPHSQSPGPQDGGATSPNVCGLLRFSAPFSDFSVRRAVVLQRNPLWFIICKFNSWLSWFFMKVSRCGLKDNTTWETPTDETWERQRWKWPEKLRCSGYLVVLDPGCGCSCENCWLFGFLSSAALAPACLSHPIDRAACQASSPAPVLLVYGQTPLSDLLFPIRPEPKSDQIRPKPPNQWLILKYHIILTGWFAHKPHRWCCQTPFASPPLFLQSYLKAQRCLTSHPRTPAMSPSGSRSLIFLLNFWLL